MRAQKYLKSLLEKFVEDNGYTWPEKASIEPPKDEKFGDLATNLAMMLTKQAGKAPRDVAAAIADAIRGNGSEIEKVEIAGPGFLNITFSPAFWQRTVPAVIEAGDAFGNSDMGKGQKAQVEYVSANPTGPLHIGHGRGAAVGDSLARILRAAGYDTHTEYYLNDAGRQMRILGNSVWVRMQRLLGIEVPDPEDFYKGDYIIDIAQRLLDIEGEGIKNRPEDEIQEICREFAMNDILDGIKADLADFNVEHQVWFSEKSLLATGAVDKTFKLLAENGLAYDKDGAFWFKSTQFGDDKDRVLRKSDGSLTYFASDIAYHDNKYDRGFDLCVDIWGADHHGYVPRMKAAVEALGKNRDSLEVILVQLVNLLRGGEQVAMSTRAGEFETLADVVKETGADAARFMFLSRKSDSHLDFDLELVKQKTMDNPVYYVQYAHARICSVMAKAAERGIALPEPSAELVALLSTDEDIRLLKLLAQYPGAVESAARNLSPHFISYYLQELAGALHRYYHANQILGAETPELVNARMCLLAAVAQVVRNGLGLLGVTAPERM
ncbi:arginyl-tRNA synthetase [Desulfobaculum xiamenense]|uniref:Arginine--tRNA ligase n=1 Tax=Desulfobaculum xiamenense TaxID=995050 RepID=A0A846QW88_9BACT|nr:arginine--tRNA ligase [Desulfobaculum xiamenense]NJB69374.1 arginyl-tRNA synthetase [Desulfobaculum xiamenense]